MSESGFINTLPYMRQPRDGETGDAHYYATIKANDKGYYTMLVFPTDTVDIRQLHSPTSPI
jgi:hypothetical protein